MSKLKIGVVISSTRPTRFGDKPAAWIAEKINERAELSAEIRARVAPGAVSLNKLEPGRVPIEALAPVEAFNALLQRLAESMGAVRRLYRAAAVTAPRSSARVLNAGGSEPST